MQFGFRARDESRKLKWGDISLITDATTKKMKLFCGPAREAPKPAMERAQEPSIQQLKQQVMSIVQSSITSLLRAIGLKKC